LKRVVSNGQNRIRDSRSAEKKPDGINEEVIRKAVMVALALNCKIRDEPLRFLRKHYFYPDLPSNYQRTSEPFAVEGELNGVRIREIHIEEDPGRYELREGIVDYNRSGVPLIEIVTEPDMTTVEEARDFLKHLRAVLDYLDVILYPEIGFRVDANVSIEGGERVEVKNINSIHGVVRALKYVLDKELGDLFEGLAKRFGVKNAVSFCLNLRGELNYRDKYLAEIPGRERLIKLAELYFSGKITKPVYVEYLRRILDDPAFVPAAQEQLSDEELRRIAREIISANPQAVADYKSGEKKAVNFLVGQIVAKTKGRADPRKAIQILRAELQRL